jgi:hypothetical protein
MRLCFIAFLFTKVLGDTCGSLSPSPLYSPLPPCIYGEQDLLGQVSRLRKREGQKYVNFYGKSCRTKVILKNI